jgi:hypothetical protein
MDGLVAARFRWGQQVLDPVTGLTRSLDYFGPANIGEVEDYFLPASNVVIGLSGDYNDDQKVDAADYVVWRKNTGNNPLPNDNGSTTQAERFNLWRANFGNPMPAGGGGAAVPLTPAESSSPSVSGASTAGSRLSAQSSPVPGPVVEVFAPTVGYSTKLLPGATGATAVSFSPLPSGFNVAGSTSVSTERSTGSAQPHASTSRTAQPFADLLLVDQALAGLDYDASDDAPLRDHRTSEDEYANDLALAAAFDDESNWWSL